jgi:hypothetical protein
MKVLSPKAAQFSEGGNDLLLDVLERAQHPYPLLLTQLVELTPAQQLLHFF